MSVRLGAARALAAALALLATGLHAQPAPRFEDRGAGPDEGWRVRVGGEIAVRVQYQRDPRFGSQFEGSDGITMQRAFAFADVAYGLNWRVFAQLYGTTAQGRRGGETPVDASGLEWQNAFLEWRTPDLAHGVRAGEQELRFGSGRLVDAREGLNVRRRFSGTRAWTRLGDWRVEAVRVRPRHERPSSFDDVRDPTQRLEGLVASRENDRGSWGAYLLWRDDAAAVGNEGGLPERGLPERRRTAALHHIGSAAGWEWNVEAMYQSGDAAGRRIDAHALFAEGDYGRPHWPGGLRIGALLGWSSGDNARGDGRLGTFDPLYARGNLLDEDATLFPRNLRNLQATAEFAPARGWFVQMSAGVLWRDSLGDGVYRPVGPPLVDAGGSRERRVASTISGFTERRWDSGVSLLLRAAVLQPGPFLEDRGLREPTVWGEAALRYRF